MPDGDKVHKHLSGPYQQLYKRLCEGRDNPQMLGEDAMRPLRRSLQHYGDGPISLIAQVMKPIDRLPKEPILEQLALDKARQSIPVIARSIHGNKRGIALAADACRQVIASLASDSRRSRPVRDAYAKYIVDVYRASFEDRIPLSPFHDGGVDYPTLEVRLEMTRPYIERNAEGMADQLAKGREIRKLRLSRRSTRNQTVDLDERLV